MYFDPCIFKNLVGFVFVLVFWVLCLFLEKELGGAERESQADPTPSLRAQCQAQSHKLEIVT